MSASVIRADSYDLPVYLDIVIVHTAVGDGQNDVGTCACCSSRTTFNGTASTHRRANCLTLLVVGPCFDVEVYRASATTKRATETTAGQGEGGPHVISAVGGWRAEGRGEPRERLVVHPARGVELSVCRIVVVRTACAVVIPVGNP